MTTEGQGRAADPVGLGIPVVIDGPWIEPRIYPDMAGILDNPDAAYAKLKDMVAGKYNPPAQTVDSEVNSKIVALLDPFKKKTEYATGYAPPAALTSPTTTSSTGATT